MIFELSRYACAPRMNYSFSPPMNSVPPRPSTRISFLVCSGLGTLMLALIATRVLPGWSFLVQPDGVLVLPGMDPYYHFRHASYCLQNFPELLRADLYSHYPDVVLSDAAGLYDVVLAGLAHLLMWAGLPAERALGWVCMWFPPLAMAAILPLVYARMRSVGTACFALLMALWVWLLPGSGLAKTSLGFCDHHVVEMFLSVLCIHVLVKLVTAERANAGPLWRPALGAALPLAAIQFSWLGAPLWLPLFVLALVGQLVADVVSGAGALPLLRAAWRFWLGFLLIMAATGLLWPELVLVPWLWRATLLGTLALLAMIPLAAWFFESSRLRLQPAVRLIVATVVLGGLLVVATVVSPQIREMLGKMLDPKTTQVSENVAFTWLFFFQITGLAGLLAIIAPVVGLLNAAGRRPGWWVAVLSSLAFVLLWTRTYDYGYQGALHAVIVSGYVLAAISGSGPRRWMLPVASTVFVVLGVWPFGWTTPLWQPAAYYQDGAVYATPAWRQAMQWLRTQTPAPSEPLAGRVGVLTDWSRGNLVNTLARRPSTSAGYAEAEGLRPLFAENEDLARNSPFRSSTVADSVRYVALGVETVGGYFPTHINTAGINPARYSGREVFYDRDRNRITAPTFGTAYDSVFAVRLFRHDGEGLVHFRLIYESPAESFIYSYFNPATKGLKLATETVDSVARGKELRNRLAAVSAWQEADGWAYQGQLLASVKLFEQVEGARLTGRADPAVPITLSIPLLIVSSGRTFTYQQTVRADIDGTFEIICPYSTEALSASGVEMAGLATLSWPEGSVNVEIPEAAVQQGTVVPVSLGRLALR